MPQAGPIPSVSGRFAVPIDPDSIVFSLIDNMATASVTNCLAWRLAWAKGPDNLLYQTLFEHPLSPARPRGSRLPHRNAGAEGGDQTRLSLWHRHHRAHARRRPRMSVEVNDKELSAETQVQKEQPHARPWTYQHTRDMRSNLHCVWMLAATTQVTGRTGCNR